jgi:aminoglycoside phosphotransferase
MASIFSALTAGSAATALRQAGFDADPSDLNIELRYERWAVSLPGNRMVWFAATAAGYERLTMERKVLRLIVQRCSFHVPQILHESDAGFDVRALVMGCCDAERLFEIVKADADISRRIGGAIGAVLAEQHTRITRADVAGWLTERMIWPAPASWIMENLSEVVEDSALIAKIGKLLEHYESQPVDSGDCVLVHGDVGFHNLVVDEATDLIGIFDYDSAAWADRHHDFRYLVFETGREELLEAALAVYQPLTGHKLERTRIQLYNAACAASYLAYRRGIPADRKWCGRTLAEDLQWVHSALRSLH